MSIWQIVLQDASGQFSPNLGGHFELESGVQFKLELGGQYDWNLQFSYLFLGFLFIEINKPIPTTTSTIFHISLPSPIFKNGWNNKASPI